MKRLKVLGLLLMAVSMLGALTVASSSSAAEMKNPEFKTAAGPGTSTSTAGTLFGVAEIKCKDDTDKTTETNKKEGTLSVDFLECTLLGEECHSLGDKAGVILTGGTTKLVLLDPKAGEDKRGLVIAIATLHIECKFLSTLAVVSGSVIGTIEAKAGSKKEFTIGIHAKGAKEQEFKEYLTEKEEKVKATLSTATNEGTASESGEESGTDVLKTEKETELIN